MTYIMERNYTIINKDACICSYIFKLTHVFIIITINIPPSYDNKKNNNKSETERFKS